MRKEQFFLDFLQTYSLSFMQFKGEVGLCERKIYIIQVDTYARNAIEKVHLTSKIQFIRSKRSANYRC